MIRSIHVLLGTLDSYLTVHVKTKKLLHDQITVNNYLKYNLTLFTYVCLLVFPTPTKLIRNVICGCIILMNRTTQRVPLL